MNDVIHRAQKYPFKYKIVFVAARWVQLNETESAEDERWRGVLCGLNEHISMIDIAANDRTCGQNTVHNQKFGRLA